MVCFLVRTVTGDGGILPVRSLVMWSSVGPKSRPTLFVVGRTNKGFGKPLVLHGFHGQLHGGHLWLQCMHTKDSIGETVRTIHQLIAHKVTFLLKSVTKVWGSSKAAWNQGYLHDVRTWPLWTDHMSAEGDPWVTPIRFIIKGFIVQNLPGLPLKNWCLKH